jgi:hypothetical protein
VPFIETSVMSFQSHALKYNPSGHFSTKTN